MEKAFEDAIHGSKDKIEMSNEEQQKFKKAMKDPEFCKMLTDYMDEISDPKYRKETEEYLAQLERDNQVPSSKELIRPKPGFVIKVKIQDEHVSKVFINVCHSEKLEKPIATAQEGGTKWQLPYSIGPYRTENDKAGNTATTFDVCFHTETLQRSHQNEAFRDMVSRTSMEAVQNSLTKDGKAKVLSQNYHVIRGVNYKSGEPVTMCISKPKSSTPDASQAKGSIATKDALQKNDDKSECVKSTLPATSSIASDKCNKTTSKKPNSVAMKGEVAKNVPNFQIIQRGVFDMSKFIKGRTNAVNHPKQLVVKVKLPQLNSASKVDLDVSQQTVKLLAPGYELLTFPLPYKVNDAKGSANFNKANSELQVVLPVIPPQEMATEIPAMGAGFDDLKKEGTETESIKADEPPKIKKASTNEQTHRRWLNTSNTTDDIGRIIRENANMAIEDFTGQQNTRQESNAKVKSKPSASTEPKYRFSQTQECVSLLIDVCNIAESSLQISFEKNAFSCSFQDNSSKQFCIEGRLANAIYPEKSRYDIAAENMLIVMVKEKPKLSWLQIWQSDTGAMSESVDSMKLQSDEPPIANASKSQATEKYDPIAEPVHFKNEIMYQLD